MSRARFGTLLALVCVVVAGSSFAVALAALDDGAPDPPPRSSASAGDVLGGGPDTSAATSSTTASAVTGSLDTPVWVTVVASEADEAGATTIAQRVATAGYPSGVLRSDDYPSLTAGFWVAYAGPFADRPAAEAAVAALATDGFGGAYARCAGSTEDCSDTG